MRKNTAFFSMLGMGALALASCSQGTDPALIAAISKSNESSVDTSALETKIEALNKSVSSISDDLSGVKQKLTGEVTQVGLSLGSLKTKIDDLESMTKKARDAAESGQDAQAMAALKKQYLDIESNMRKIRETMDAMDMTKYIALAREAADSQGEIIKAKEDNKRKDTEIANLHTQLSEAKNSIKDLNDTIEGMKAGDVSRHPTVKTLRNDLTRAAERETKLKEDYDQMKQLADKQAEEIRQLRAGGAVVKKDPKEETKKTSTSFEYRVSNASFRADTQEYTVLANYKSGEPPVEGMEVLIVDLDDQIVCRLRIDEVYPADEDRGMSAQIGGETINASTRNAPIKGYRVIPARSASASGR